MTARLSHLNHPERMREFMAADIVTARDTQTGETFAVFGPLLERVNPEPLTRVRAEIVVPMIRARGELLLLLEDCLEFKKSCDYELLGEEKRRQGPEPRRAR